MPGGLAWGDPGLGYIGWDAPGHAPNIIAAAAAAAVLDVIMLGVYRCVQREEPTKWAGAWPSPCACARFLPGWAGMGSGGGVTTSRRYHRASTSDLDDQHVLLLLGHG